MVNNLREGDICKAGVNEYWEALVEIIGEHANIDEETGEPRNQHHNPNSLPYEVKFLNDTAFQKAGSVVKLGPGAWYKLIIPSPISLENE